jgi:calpain-15
VFDIEQAPEATNPATLFPEEQVDDPGAEDPRNDKFGAVRNWRNWVNPSFVPIGSQAPVTNQPIFKAVEISHGLNTLNPQSEMLNQLLSHCRSVGSPFEDNQFEPSMKSLVGYNEAKTDRTEKFGTYTWERPQKAMGQKHYTVGGSPVGPQDIRQGKLGNCYFVAALSAISEHPERIRRIIKVKEPTNNGFNCISLNVTGLWEDVFIDDRIPYDPAKKKPAFCSSVGNDMWVMLIEKAWAKVHGGYSNIEAGYINEALAGLTGAPVKIFRVKENEDEAWNNLLEVKQKNYITCASTSDITKVVSEIPSKESGLVGGHAYSLLAAFEIEDRGKPVRLVKFRNPWGKGEWKGEWSDGSKKWTSELKEKCKIEDKDDGIFHMTFKDAGQYFHDFAICHYRDKYVNSAKKFMTSPELPTIITFAINQPGEYYFRVNQISKRIFQKNDMYTYTPLTLVVARVDGNQLSYVGNACRARDQTWVLSDCRPGNYIAYITTPWKRDCNHMSFSIYGPTMIDFQAQEPNYLPPDFIQSMMMDCARKNPKGRIDFKSKNEPNIFYIKARSDHMDELSYYYFCNQSQTTTLKVTCTPKDLRDAEVMKPWEVREGQDFDFYVKPGEEQIIIVRLTGMGAKLNLVLKFGFKRKK